jgi:hypothetical protein
MSVAHDSGGADPHSRQGASDAGGTGCQTGTAQAPAPPLSSGFRVYRGEGPPREIEPLALAVQPSLAERRAAAAAKKRAAEEAKELRRLAREEKKIARATEDEAYEASRRAHALMHARLTRHYFAVYKEARGCTPPFDGAEGKALYRLMKKLHYVEADIEMTISAALKDQFLSNGASLLRIAHDPGRYKNAMGRAGMAKSRGRFLQPAHPGPVRHLEEA